MNSRKNAQAVYSYATAPIIGAAVLTGAERAPATITNALTPFMVAVWGIVMVAAGLMCLVGVFHPDPVKGLILEMSGCRLLMVPTIAYGLLAIDAYGAQTAAVMAGLSIGIGLAAWARSRQCLKTLESAGGG